MRGRLVVAETFVLLHFEQLPKRDGRALEGALPDSEKNMKSASFHLGLC